ncbi:Peptidoglycan-N-acetylglucosamine deacetylase [Pseudobythopirellula maris]|uniref:Peptidoglycan-N-acetylglucosamine deacetylase n=1 Tax=Pseudobythopirellula maris TaxID=2527991 RepID=A0A5C5ZT61_9BACT|nr:polysaccharide deacetylase family protein [Pseudobythopirellula maris]TWT90235.1 Peptidoglycan-N-acetylglucosamine deacetylase [Pseudobythopirellula maris]
MPTPIASLSLDLDNLWAYLRSAGDPSWRDRPSYLAEVTPRVLDFLGEREMIASFFVVGDDLTRDEDARAVEAIAAAGHEIGNHSHSHLPWLDSLPIDEQREEVARGEEAIRAVTGASPAGFRAPGFAWSPELLGVLAERGYAYDASLFPTFVGPLARLYCKVSRIRSTDAERDGDAPPEQRFSSLRDALRPLRPHSVATPAGPIAVAPVTTFPLLRSPIHMTYLSFLAEKSPKLAMAYWRTALRACRLRGVAPSLLLHPLDFMGAGECPAMDRFPGMRLARDPKMRLLGGVLDALADGRRVTTIAQHVAAALPASPSHSVAAA